MSHSTKKPIEVGILEISSQNKAILEYFFSDAGKSYFKEVSLDKASTYIIDYDSLGAKESWESTFKRTKKPGIIISIKEVDLPSTIWLQKPLTVKALKEAGESIREMILNDEENAATVTVIDDSKEKVTEIITQETIKEKVLEDEPKLDTVLSDEIIDLPSTPIDEIIFSEGSTEITSSDNQEESIEEINIIELPEIVIQEEDEKTEEAFQKVIEEEKLQLDNLPIVEIIETPEENLLETINNEIVEEISADEFLISVENKEPELAFAEMSDSASSTHFAASTNFVDIDLSLDDANDNIDKNIKSNEPEPTALQTPIDEPEITTTNDKNDSDVNLLLKSLISGGENNEKVNNLLTDFTEGNADSDLIDFEKETVEEKIPVLAEFVVKDVKTYTEEKIEAEPLATTIDDEQINKILHSEDKVKQPKKKSAEEELQSLLEEIRQEADDASLTTPTSQVNGVSQAYMLTTAEERWKLICGENTHTDLHRLGSFNPDNHVLSLIIKNVENAKQSKQIVRLKFKGIIVVIDPATDHIYCDRSIYTEFYANICYEPIVKDKIKIHNLDASELRLYRKKMQEDKEHTHGTEAFIWTTSLLTARGRLPKNTNLKSKIGLTTWPNLTRVENIPHMMQIAALFHKNTWSLLEITNKSGVSREYVVAFYNAVLALDMIEANEAAISSEPLDLKKSDNKDRSLFSRFLKKITA